MNWLGSKGIRQSRDKELVKSDFIYDFEWVSGNVVVGTTKEIRLLFRINVIDLGDFFSKHSGTDSNHTETLGNSRE